MKFKIGDRVKLNAVGRGIAMENFYCTLEEQGYVDEQATVIDVFPSMFRVKFDGGYIETWNVSYLEKVE